MNKEIKIYETRDYKLFNDDGKISLLDEAYVTTFSALKYWDERHKESEDEAT